MKLQKQALKSHSRGGDRKQNPERFMAKKPWEINYYEKKEEKFGEFKNLNSSEGVAEELFWGRGRRRSSGCEAASVFDRSSELRAKFRRVAGDVWNEEEESRTEKKEERPKP